MKIPLALLLVVGTATASAGCRSATRPVAAVTHRPAASLPETTLPWLTLRDHFVATVGAHAGQGRRLGPLVVLADATFAPRSRFPLHAHREMDILSVVIDGTLSHQGSLANGATLGPRGAQLIAARGGMEHAEGNDTDRPTRMLQLWFEPDHLRGGAAAYFSRQLTGAGRELLAGDEGMPLGADARVWWLSLRAGASEPLVVEAGRRGYLLALAGPLAVGPATGAAGVTLETGDGAEVGPGELLLTASGARSALWIDLPSTATVGAAAGAPGR